ncbi:lanthionine synthetase C family protein [Amycolatopsis anabasis]|uniref:lanthionine synthetase C family protein n=1 Tax=Amycolatopsis anabasis TaxID=1840409 RepID=UPI001FEB2803|nr:lanthionine synthetase C family protein [Amycolatopsis anabasis]
MTTRTVGQPTRLAEAIAARLATPTLDADDRSGREQSLAHGAAGGALLHIERALLGLGSWSTAHAWVATATTRAVSAADDTGLYLGAPAISFILHAAQADHTRRYGPALSALGTHVALLAHRRVDAALARTDRGDTATFAEYDLFSGLTGIGQLLLQHTPGNDALERILDYLVRLTRPSRADHQQPGWWVSHHPDPQLPTPGGHTNLGLAHGISGVLAFLGAALRRGTSVDGHAEAIATICAHLDAWRQDDEPGPWWPQWITQDELRTGRTRQPGPLRPSWCYGTPGIARAQQIAALATGDTARQTMAEHALAACLSDPAQLAHVTDTGLCHGWSGLHQTAWRAAHDALSPEIGRQLPRLAESLTQHADHDHNRDTGLLDGAAGVALALHTAARNEPPISGWDACLLIA